MHEGKVFHFIGDRTDKEQYQKVILQIYENHIKADQYDQFDLVVDFCAYDTDDMKVTVPVLHERTKLYLYICTDSTYEACEIIYMHGQEYYKDYIQKHPQGLTEDLAYLNDSLTPKDLMKMKKLDSYGFKKLQAETYLFQQSKLLNFRALALRLPDVLGPYDETQRFWSLLIWLLNADKCPVHIDDLAKTQKLSFVFSKDVVKIITGILNDQELLDQVSGIYNIGCEEQVTLVEFYEIIWQIISQRLNKQVSHQLKEIEEQGCKKMFPSVSCGPIDIRMGKTALKYNQVSLQECLESTVDFFLNIKPDQYFKERSDMFQGLPSFLRKQLIQDCPHDFKQVIDKYLQNKSDKKDHSSDSSSSDSSDSSQEEKKMDVEEASYSQQSSDQQ
eukprot:403333379